MVTSCEPTGGLRAVVTQLTLECTNNRSTVVDVVYMS